MKTENIVRNFTRMGARVNLSSMGERDRPRTFAVLRGGRRMNVAAPYRMDIQRDGDGEFFDFKVSSGEVELNILDVQPKDRHLLLTAKAKDVEGNVVVNRFLCGHDERHWFIAPVPGRPTTVVAAKEQLKPTVAVEHQQRVGLKVDKAQRRKNKAFVRQGEWFFIPQPADFKVPATHILKNEVLQRGTRRGFGKPHTAQELYRTGGESVWVCRRYPQGVLESQYKKLITEQPKLKDEDWRSTRRNMTAYVRGRITHPDHATLTLKGWHLVVPNRESETPVGRELVFLD